MEVEIGKGLSGRSSRANRSDIFIKEIGAEQYLISAYDSAQAVVSFYLRQISGACTKKNSIPVVNSDLKDVLISPDQKKILLKVSIARESLSSDQVFYVPLNGEAPLAVNTALLVGAKISSFQFLQDSKTILYVGDQLSPGEPGVFVWRAPESL